LRSMKPPSSSTRWRSIVQGILVQCPRPRETASWKNAFAARAEEIRDLFYHQQPEL
jgi:hypothetical protein